MARAQVSTFSHHKLGMLGTGVTQLFKMMDIGSLELGDYLGIGFASFIFSSEKCIAFFFSSSDIIFLTHFIRYTQLLELFSLQQILCAHCRYNLSKLIRFITNEKN